MLFRTYPRVPFWEQIHDSIPFYTDSGRLASYCDLPEAIEYGENLCVHREAVEATPYLPNVIVSTSPFIRPVDYGIPLDTIDPDLRQVRNVKMSWDDVKKTVNPLVAARLFVLLLHTQEPPLDALILVDRRLALDLERQFRRPAPHRQTLARRRRSTDSDQPPSGARRWLERRRLRLGRRQ